MSQGTTIKGKTADDRNVAVKVDADGQLYVVSSGGAGLTNAELRASPVTVSEKTMAQIYENTTALGSNGNLTSVWLDISAYRYIDAILYADQSSATNGVVLSLSADGGVTTHKTLASTYTAGFGANGYSIPLTGYTAVKVSYTNGGIAQTDFHVRVLGGTGSNPLPFAPLGATINPTYSALLTRAVLAAQNPSGTMSNLITTAGGYLRNSLAQVEVDLPIKALTTLEVKQESIGLVSVQITAVATARKTISFKARTSNAGLVFIGTASTVTTSNGYELAAGDAVEFDLTEGQSIWAIADAASQTLCVAEVS